MKILYRPQKIVIDTPKYGNDPWVEITVQKVTMNDDNSIVQTEDRFDRIYKPLSKHVSEIVAIDDPIVGVSITQSIAGIAKAIQYAIGVWMKERYGGELGLGGIVV